MKPLLFGLLFTGLAAAQTIAPRVEVGGLLGTLDQHRFGEKPLLGGGRVTVHLFRFIDADVEVNRIPIGGAVANFPATQGLFGARAIYHFGHLAVFGRARGGFISFDRNTYAPLLEQKPALDIGGGVELYSSHHVAARIDVGDTMIDYGSTPVISPGSGQTLQLNTQSNFQASFGISLWF